MLYSFALQEHEAHDPHDWRVSDPIVPDPLVSVGGYVVETQQVLEPANRLREELIYTSAQLTPAVAGSHYPAGGLLGTTGKRFNKRSSPSRSSPQREPEAESDSDCESDAEDAPSECRAEPEDGAAPQVPLDPEERRRQKRTRIRRNNRANVRARSLSGSTNPFDDWDFDDLPALEPVVDPPALDSALDLRAAGKKKLKKPAKVKRELSSDDGSAAPASQPALKKAKREPKSRSSSPADAAAVLSMGMSQLSVVSVKTDSAGGGAPADAMKEKEKPGLDDTGESSSPSLLLRSQSAAPPGSGGASIDGFRPLRPEAVIDLTTPEQPKNSGSAPQLLDKELEELEGPAFKFEDPDGGDGDDDLPELQDVFNVTRVLSAPESPPAGRQRATQLDSPGMSPGLWENEEPEYAKKGVQEERFLKFTEDYAKRENLVDDTDQFRAKWCSAVDGRSAAVQLAFAIVMRTWDWGAAAHQEELSLVQLRYLMNHSTWRAHSNGTHVYDSGAWVECSNIDYASAKDVQHMCQLACGLLLAAKYDENLPDEPFPRRQDMVEWLNKRVVPEGAAAAAVALNPPGPARFRVTDKTILKHSTWKPEVGGDATTWDKKTQSLINAATRLQKTETCRVMLEKLLQWGLTEKKANPTLLNFDNCQLQVGGGQVRKAPENNCYNSLPYPLHHKFPAHEVAKIRKLLATTYAGAPAARFLEMAGLTLALRDIPAGEFLFCYWDPSRAGLQEPLSTVPYARPAGLNFR